MSGFPFKKAFITVSISALAAFAGVWAWVFVNLSASPVSESTGKALLLLREFPAVAFFEIFFVSFFILCGAISVWLVWKR